MKKFSPIKIKPKVIKDIAENLECGLECYYHLQTGDYKAVPNVDDLMYADSEAWEEDLQEIEENWKDYLKFEKMSSRESFIVMEEFAEEVDHEGFKNLIDRGLE